MLGANFAAGIALLILGSCSGASNITDPEERLIKQLLDGYDKTIRPGVIKNGVKQPLGVSVAFAPYRISALDDRLETMSLLAYVGEYWEDSRLTWDPKEHGGMTTVDVAPGNVWVPRSYFPNLLVLNREDKTEVHTVQINTTQVLGTASMFMVTYALLQERCEFHMEYYPFDRQTCSICVYPTQSSMNELRYQAYYAPFDFPVDGGEWDLEYGIAFNSTLANVGLACLQLTVQRRSIYYVVNLFVPTLCICLLNTIGLFASIDADQDELDFANLGQTTLLSLSVLMLTVADQTPRGSLTVSLMGLFFLCMIFQTLAAAVTAVYLRKWYKRNKTMSQHVIYPRTTAPNVVKIQAEKKWIRRCMAFHLFLIAVFFTVVMVAGAVNKQYKPEV